jgi:hypothetical protein
MPKATGLDSSWFEERLIGLWLAFPRLAKPNPMPEKAIFSSPLWQEVYIRWVNEYTKSDFNPKSFLDGLDATSALQTAEAALVAKEEYGKLEPGAVEREASFYLQEIRRRYREIRRAQMMQEINEAEKSNNLEKLNQLLEEFRLL